MTETVAAGTASGDRTGTGGVARTETGAATRTGEPATRAEDPARAGEPAVIRTGAGDGTSAGRIPEVAGFAGRGGAGGGKAYGKALRARVPRGAHAEFVRDPARPDPLDAVAESNRGRLPALTPLRAERMAASPFAFLRGAAGLMAYDLARTPVTGVGAQLCGDAHAANFGLYGDARGELVIDLNDFDETVHGPWEWDVKRLATSLVLAGRGGGGGRGRVRGRGARCGGRVPAHHAAARERSPRSTPGTPSPTRASSRTPTRRTSRARSRASRRRRAATRARASRRVRPRRRRTAGGASWTRRPYCAASGTRRRRPSRGRSATGSRRSPRTGSRCSPVTRCTTSPSASSARAVSARARTWCCSSTTGASRSSSR